MLCRHGSFIIINFIHLSMQKRQTVYRKSRLHKFCRSSSFHSVFFCSTGRYGYPKGTTDSFEKTGSGRQADEILMSKGKGRGCRFSEERFFRKPDIPAFSQGVREGYMNGFPEGDMDFPDLSEDLLLYWHDETETTSFCTSIGILTGRRQIYSGGFVSVRSFRQPAETVCTGR